MEKTSFNSVGKCHVVLSIWLPQQQCANPRPYGSRFCLKVRFIVQKRMEIKQIPRAILHKRVLRWSHVQFSNSAKVSSDESISTRQIFLQFHNAMIFLPFWNEGTQQHMLWQYKSKTIIWLPILPQDEIYGPEKNRN